MVVTSVAWRQLSPQEQEQAHALLKAHPKYKEWSDAYPADVQGLSKGMYVAMAASLWADDIRDKNNPATHPEWHYVDYPLVPPHFPNEPAPNPTNDVLVGIKECERVITSPATSPQGKGEMVSWLIHLVGDVHQPLHCASLTNNDFPAPEGDRGGNSAFVRPDKESKAINLHMVWDSQLGGARVADAGSSREALNKAILLETEHPRGAAAELQKSPSPESWSLEGRELAIQEAYLHGNLRYAVGKQLNAPVLPEGYTKKARAISERRVTLAGYRLADMLKRLLAVSTAEPERASN